MPKISNQQVIDDWSKIPSDFLKNFGNEGDFSRKYLLNPTIFKLLGNIKGKIVLDAGCGNGYLSVLMAKKGGVVTGIEPAKTLIDFAIATEGKNQLGIKYIQGDLSSFSEMKQKFDAVVSNMVFMDIPDYKEAIKNCINAIKPGGLFVFSISHPAFEESSSEYLKKHYIVVKEYFKEFETKPLFGYSFHHPLSNYINLVIKLGCIIKEIAEPQLDEKILKINPEAERDFHVPSFLVIKAEKS